MTNTTGLDAGAVLSVRNIGGISQTTVDISDGVTVLEGRNATNRTSFLRAIMAAIGSDNASLKGDVDEGRVELTIGDESYTRTFTRTDRGVQTDGTPYVEETTKADLFAFLLETNDARRAVAMDGDLRGVIMRPVDVDELEAEIERARAERDRLTERINELESRESERASVEERRATLQAEIEAVEAELETVNERLAEAEETVEASKQQRAELEDRIQSVRERREELAAIQDDRESIREQQDALRAERASLREERDEIETTVSEISDIGARIGRLQERKRTLDSTLDRLQSVIQFNRDALRDDSDSLVEALTESDGDVTDGLIADDTVICWTCGSDVAREDIEETLAELESVRSERMEERSEVIEQLESLKEEKQAVERRQQRREQIEHQLERIADRLEQNEQRLSDVAEREATIEDEIAATEREIAEMEDDLGSGEILELNDRSNELSFELERLRSDLEEVEAEIAEVEDDLAERESLRDQREEVKARLTDLRTRIDSLEANAVDAFNDHMSDLLDILGYENLERIWIERKTPAGGGESVTAEGGEFDLHIVRTSESGTVYEDTVDHLSESEREVAGLVFALAGYLVHDVYEDVPFMLLDSLEAIDSERIAALIDYFREYATYLVVALLPEDAQAVDDAHRRITSI